MKRQIGRHTFRAYRSRYRFWSVKVYRPKMSRGVDVLAGGYVFSWWWGPR